MGFGERRGKAFVGGQRGGALALQVAQLHEASRRGLVDGVGGNEAFRQGRRLAEQAVAFERIDARVEPAAPARAHGATLRVEPGVELDAIGKGQAGEKVAVAVVKVMRDAGREREQLAALHDDVGVEPAAQPKQPLAQDIACVLRLLLGPEQLQQALARRRTLDGDESEQRRIDRRQRPHGAVEAANRRRARQPQAQAGRRACAVVLDDLRRRHRVELPLIRAAI